MRKKIFDIIEPPQDNSIFNSIYDIFMIIVILLSIVPLCFKHMNFTLSVINIVCVIIFTIDYLLRWLTADYKYNKKSLMSFVRYPFGFFAVIDLISILPSLLILNRGLSLLKLLRVARVFRAFRVFKMFRYSRCVRIFVAVFNKSRESLIAVGTLVAAYIIISALLVFNVEPGTFDNFFDAVYWSTISLTTVGYGDIYPVTTIGKCVTIISSIFGIAVVALPASIITAGYMSELENDKK